MFLFSLATLAPLPLLVLGALLGGPWIWLALFYLTLFTFTLDQAVAMASRNAAQGAEFPAADRLSTLLALAHFALLPLGIWALAGGTGLGAVERGAVFFSFGLFFGQVSNSNAHELIHRGSRGLFTLGKWVFISLLFGHHTSAHRLVHHVHAATPKDPNSAHHGQSYYHFLPRAWVGSFRAGLAAERARMTQAKGARLNPYYSYVGGALALLVLVLALAGWRGLLAYLALAFYAQAQLMLSDYVQHYGLSRRILPDGRPEPVGPQHSWNTRHWFSSALMLNAPRHSDHHSHPARPYPALQLPESAPLLPYSLPAMCAAALVPPLWRKMMDRRAARVRERYA